MLRLTLTACQSLVALTASLLACSVDATASSVGPTLPGYVPTASCTSGQLGVDEGPSSCSQQDVNGSDSVTLTELPFAGLSANASVAGFVQDSFGAVGDLNYSFEVTGGNPGDAVPLLIFTDLSTSISGDAYAFAETEVLSEDLTFLIGSVTACTGASCSSGSASDFSGSFGVTVDSGTIYTIHMGIEASVNPVLGPATSSAGADPLIEIDPSFSNAADYTISESSGVGNGLAPAPEPGTLILVCWALFVLPVRKYLRLAARFRDV